MTPDQLDLMEARTGSARLRLVTADDWPDVAERDDAREWVREMSAFDVWPPPQCEGQAAPKRDLSYLKRSGNKCWFKYQDETCGCSGRKCFLIGRAVTIFDCSKCEWTAHKKTPAEAGA